MKIKFTFKSGKQQICFFRDITPHIDQINRKLDLGIIRDYEILG
jgi:hypothetical protein